MGRTVIATRQQRLIHTAEHTWDKQEARKHQFVWRSISLFDLASDSELTLALMIIIRLTWYSLSPSEPTITSLAHSVRTQSVWGPSHRIIPGYLSQPLLTNTLNITHKKKKKKKKTLMVMNTHAQTWASGGGNMHSLHCTYELAETCAGEPSVDLQLIFSSQKCLVKVKTAAVTSSQGVIHDTRGYIHSVSNRKLLMMALC